MPTNPRANPGVLHVDGPTRGAVIAVIEREFSKSGYDAAWLVKILCKLPVSAEPLREDDERFTIYYCPKCGRHKCDPGDMVIHSRDCGGTYGPIEVVRVSAEPIYEWRADGQRATGELRDWYEYALKTIAGPSDSGPLMDAYRVAGGGYEGLQAIAREALEGRRDG